jgi:hypothetical protein
MYNSTSLGDIKDGIDNFLSSIDSVLNSNTFLLNIPIEKEHMDLSKFISDFIRSKDFKQLMFQQDIVRNWNIFGIYNLHSKIWEEFNYTGEFYKEDFRLSIKKCTYEEFKKRLFYMLTTNESFYEKQLSNQEATLILNNFLQEIFNIVDINDNINGWKFYSIKPDFLNRTYIFNEKSGEEEQNTLFCYFDGFGFDSCTVFYNEKKLYMLLTNGMP